MNSDIKHALATFTYTVSYLFMPIAFVIGVFEGGVADFATCILSSATLAGSYVLAKQPKIGATKRSLLKKLLGASAALLAIFILHHSWPALAGLIFSCALALLAWRRASQNTRNRIKRASPV